MTTESQTASGASGAAARRAAGWTLPQPEHVPRSTAAPAAVALGATLVGFGVLTSAIVSAAGAVVVVAAAVRWVREMHHAAAE